MEASELIQYPSYNFSYRDVLDAQGNLAIRIQYFCDLIPEAPTGFREFLSRVNDFLRGEYREWASTVLDSVTMMELAARYNQRYFLNKNAKDPRQWWAGSTDDCEKILMSSFGGLPINVCVVAHGGEDKDEVNGGFVRTIKAPGRLSKGVCAGYSEVYHAFVSRDTKTGERNYLLQTQPDNLWIAKTGIQAPDPSWQTWESVNPQNTQPAHFLVYGDPGSRKSTFAATLPKPMLVWFFDQVGMDLPYIRNGEYV